jgi:hypothetical protein
MLDQIKEQVQTVNNVRVYKFLEELATNSSSETTDVERKIIQLKIRRQLMENIKKMKQAMKRYTEKFILAEKEVDNIDVNILNYNNMIIEEMDMK